MHNVTYFGLFCAFQRLNKVSVRWSREC